MTREIEIALTAPTGEVETVWAEPSGDGHWIINNIPWLAHRVSLGDTIDAERDEAGTMTMVRVVRKSGNRTIRILLDVTEPARQWTPRSQALLAGLRDRGAEVENMNYRLVAVSLPFGIELASVARFIDESGFSFEYADPAFEELFPTNAVLADSAEADPNSPLTEGGQNAYRGPMYASALNSNVDNSNLSAGRSR